MARLLVVDDEPRYCELLGRSLSADGHRAATAVDARGALEAASRLRPDVLITDWMLGGDLHGIQVARAMRAVFPDLQTILVTAFATEDLRAEARRASACDLVEKPFELEQIRSSVRRVLERKRRAGPALPIGIVDAGPGGRLLLANPRAREMLSGTRAGRDATDLGSVLEGDPAAILEEASVRWCAVRALAPDPQVWHLRARRRADGEGFLLVMLPDEHKGYARHELVRTLLGILETRPPRWPFERHVLVIDDLATVRRAVVERLRQAGCFCHAAESGEVALQLVEKDPAIGFAVLDRDLPGAGPAELVRRLASLRPEVTIVGSSNRPVSGEFAEIGVSRFLPKPFAAADFINLVTGRIGSCVGCSWPIPLRRPAPGEAASRWVCCQCGARYRAVMDPGFPPEIQANVRPVETDS